MSNIYMYNEDNNWKNYFFKTMKTFNSNLKRVDKQYKFPK